MGPLRVFKPCCQYIEGSKNGYVTGPFGHGAVRARQLLPVYITFEGELKEFILVVRLFGLLGALRNLQPVHFCSREDLSILVTSSLTKVDYWEIFEEE